MIQRKLVNTFNTTALCKRAVKTVRRKYKKSIKQSEARKIWDDWCEYAVIRPLLKFGIVQIDKHTKIEIVGERYENDSRMFALMSNGLNKNGVMKKAVKFNPNRYGIKYKIVFTDSNYRGVTIFKANKKLKERVHDALVNTQTYYRIKR